MDDLYGILSIAQTDQLPALRSQQRELRRLSADINEAKSRLVRLDPSEFWSSNAQRAYRGRIDEIVHDLQGVLGFLFEAEEQIWRSMRTLQTAGEE